jgi:hypothetical protein
MLSREAQKSIGVVALDGRDAAIAKFEFDPTAEKSLLDSGTVHMLRLLGTHNNRRCRRGGQSGRRTLQTSFVDVTRWLQLSDSSGSETKWSTPSSSRCAKP